uniref:Arf-GAP domain-containing protein n=1 Tax=Capra hircus TaxID=9925 RepID=A0A8C2P267_CAPHI
MASGSAWSARGSTVGLGFTSGQCPGVGRSGPHVGWPLSPPGSESGGDIGDEASPLLCSFVRSVTMDKWKDVELEKMKAGGNARFREFLESQEDYDPCWSLQEKYNSRAAALFRDRVAALAEGKEWSLESSPAQSWTPPQPRTLLSSAHRASGLVQNSTASGDKAFEDWLNDDLGSYQGAQENRYVGFGNTVPPPKREDDFLNSAMSSLYSGWSSFATGASRFASAAKEGATKFGSQASQKASELGHSLNESVLKPAQEKVKEGKIFDDVSSGFSELASKVQGVGSRGWRDVTTFFSGRAEDSSDRVSSAQGSAPAFLLGARWASFLLRLGWDPGALMDELMPGPEWQPLCQGGCCRSASSWTSCFLPALLDVFSDPRRARATRTVVGTTPRTPSTRASGRPSGAPTLPGPTGPQVATAGHARTPRPTRGARTAGMCGARALRPRPTIGSATTATVGRPGVVAGRAGPRSPRRPRRHPRWTMAGTTRTGRAPRPVQRPLRLLPLSIPPKKRRTCKKTASAETQEPRACGSRGTSVPLCSLFGGPKPGAVAGRAPCCCRASTPSPSPESSVINALGVARGHTCSRPDFP